jgi:anti-sigma B factor antagonist
VVRGYKSLTPFSTRFTVTGVTKLLAGTAYMPEIPSPLTVTPIKDVVVVEFTNNKILDESVLEEIRSTLNRLVEAASIPKLLLDFNHVDHMTSAALGLLINVNKGIKDKNGQLRLANIKPQIFEVFVTTKLNKVFRVLGSRAEAMESFT